MEPTREFSKTVLTLDNCIVPREKLLNTPSAQDGVSHELEVDLRLVGCEYIQTAGLLLKLPQVRRKVPAPVSELGYDVILALVVVYKLCIIIPTVLCRLPWLQLRCCSRDSTTPSHL